MAGESLDNPVTGEFGVIVKAPWEGEDRSFEGELFVQPGGAVIGEHVAMFATEFRDVLVLRRPPAAIQSLLFGLLRPIARARGYRGTYPQYGRSLLAAG